MSRSRHKKLYYVPGLVSLILVPLLFAYFGKKEIQKLDVRVMEVNSWHPDYTEYWSFPERNYKQVVLTGNQINDKAVIENGMLLIKGLYASKDTLNGIQFTFTDSASYSSYVSILNYFRKENINYYVPYKNNIWVVNMPEPKKSDGVESAETDYVFICGNSFLDTGYYSTEDLGLLDTISLWCKDNLAGLVKLWPTIALLFLLVALTITQLIRHFKPTIV